MRSSRMQRVELVRLLKTPAARRALLCTPLASSARGGGVVRGRIAVRHVPRSGRIGPQAAAVLTGTLGGMAHNAAVGGRPRGHVVGCTPRGVYAPRGVCALTRCASCSRAPWIRLIATSILAWLSVALHTVPDGWWNGTK
jgi:hypothetical protein